MSALAYLVCLLLSLAGVATIDRRWRLFVWRSPRAALAVLAVGVAYLVAWDLAGIALGIFFRGQTRWMTGLQVAPELPVEELFFLLLLSWTTMCLWCGGERLAHARRGAR
ncbi:lycopene cyclase domain-containing protein [Arsenicicoccus dermatophilus]|uniref:lycopene cyclase domain-containing protein n=1 Tax=Arsenicicoccus dermatophilus TaxID=1076331 RepID=UPI0039172066